MITHRKHRAWCLAVCVSGNSAIMIGEHALQPVKPVMATVIFLAPTIQSDTLIRTLIPTCFVMP